MQIRLDLLHNCHDAHLLNTVFGTWCSIMMNQSNLTCSIPPERFQTDGPGAAITASVLAGAISLAATLENTLVPVSFWRTPSLLTPANVLLISLAMTDLGTGLITPPLFFISNIAKVTEDEALYCKVTPVYDLAAKCGAVHCLGVARPSEVQRSSHDETCLCCHCGDVALWHQYCCLRRCLDLAANSLIIGGPHPSVPGGYRQAQTHCYKHIVCARVIILHAARNNHGVVACSSICLFVCYFVWLLVCFSAYKLWLRYQDKILN